MKKSFLLLSLLCGALSAWAHDAEVDGIFYNLDARNMTATVTFKENKYNSYEGKYAGDVVIPETVTFEGLTYSVTRLGDDCFTGCSRLTSVTLPNSVTSLEDDCFAGCNSLERIEVDAANTVYDSRENCNAIIHTSTNELVVGCKNSKIPNSVTSLGYGCFGGCSSLPSITIPKFVTSLGEFCFDECSSLTTIYMLPSTPPSTKFGIFDDAPLETVYVVDEYAKTAYQAQYPWRQYSIVVMPTGIEELQTDKTTPTIVGYYDLSGRPTNGKQRGAVILRYSDGTTRKVLVK